MEEKVIKIFADYKEIDPATITSESKFSDLGFDSLDIAEMVMTLEDEFGVTIEMDGSFKTVGDIINYISEQKK